MYILPILLSIACIILLLALTGLCADIRSLSRQLEEIERGSHMELTTLTKHKSLLQLCRCLNRILLARDQSHIQYERAEKQLKQNITNLAHDIRTPLTGASGYLQLARECDNAGKREHYLSVTGRRLEELADMLEKLFLYTKLANEDFTISKESRKMIPVLPLLSDCLLSLYTKFDEQNREPELRFESEGFRVPADEDALRRIFLNLLQNALIHGIGNLVIAQRIVASQQVISDRQNEPKRNPCRETMSDPPMPQEDMAYGCLVFENSVPENSRPDPKQMFDLFYKADTARRKASSGLGLYIVKELMKRMDGDAKAELDGNTLRILLYFPSVIE